MFPLRGQSTHTALFPLPTSSKLLLDMFPSLSPPEVAWLSCVCMGLNSLWGDELHYDGEVNDVVKVCLGWLVKDIASLTGKVEHFDWDAFL